MADEIRPWSCSKCGQSYEPPAWMVKASLHLCPDCKRAYEREYRAKRKAEGRPLTSYAEPPARCRERHAKKMADPAYREARNAKARERYAADPIRRLKARTRRRTNEAIKDGRLIRRPCEVCGVAESEAHHDDYHKPLQVRWLCRKHHREHHRREA